MKLHKTGSCIMQIEELRKLGLQCVGWYHSHPTFPVLPSSIDVYNQHAQQVAHNHSAFGEATPYIAAIVGPYWRHNFGSQSHMVWFYVENRRSSQFSLQQAPEASLQHMVPKHLTVQLLEDAETSVADILACAAPLIGQYATYDARVDFTQVRSFSRVAPSMTSAPT
jgi:hypothetical protein